MAPIEPMKLEQPGQPAPKTIKVKALQAHTAFGKSYEIGDEYDIDAQFLDSITLQGKAVRVDTTKAPETKAPEPKAKP